MSKITARERIWSRLIAACTIGMAGGKHMASRTAISACRSATREMVASKPHRENLDILISRLQRQSRSERTAHIAATCIAVTRIAANGSLPLVCPGYLGVYLSPAFRTVLIAGHMAKGGGLAVRNAAVAGGQA